MIRCIAFLDEDINRYLQMLALEQGISKQDLAAEILTAYVQQQRSENYD